MSEECDHGVTFDAEAARELLKEAPQAESPLAFILGNPARLEVRRRWPRLDGACPKGCGYHGIAYASVEHYIMGGW